MERTRAFAGIRQFTTDRTRDCRSSENRGGATTSRIYRCLFQHLQRAIDTAGHIIGQRPIPLFQHCGLNEQSFGSWEGMQITDLRKLTEFKQLTNDPAAYKALSNGGETFEQLAVRAMDALCDIIKVHQSGANILVVSHGHTLRLLLSLLGGATWENHRDEGKSVSLLNTSISIVKYDSESGFHIEQLNDVAHLQ